MTIVKTTLLLHWQLFINRFSFYFCTQPPCQLSAVLKEEHGVPFSPLKTVVMQPLIHMDRAKINNLVCFFWRNYLQSKCFFFGPITSSVVALHTTLANPWPDRLCLAAVIRSIILCPDIFAGYIVTRQGKHKFSGQIWPKLFGFTPLTT